MAGVLYLVSTPIGNLADITARAAAVLEDVSVCYAEDTRRTGRLLAHLGHDVSLRSLHAHNEAARVSEIVRRLKSGEDCALVTDAGTPAVSDPGRRVVQALHDHDLRVVPVPGASAVLTALTVSGLPADRFLFLGFAPRRGPARAEWIAQVRASPDTVVVFESPRRLEQLLVHLTEAGLAERPCVLCRELTKLHEEVTRGTIAELREESAGKTIRGEVTMVIAAAKRDTEPDGEVLEQAARELARSGASTRDIVDRLCDEFGVSRNRAYEVGLRVESGNHA
jgi:16S rRNA (cytidine1402-2'-O)-methyltransferase